MNIKKSEFGEFEGIGVDLFVLSNNNGMEIKITNYGGIITSIMVPNRQGKIEDVVLGFDDLSGYTNEVYLSQNPFFGALIGRFGNRIARGKFKLDGLEYQLAINNGQNHLHGGIKGFDKVLWKAEEFKSEEGVGLKLKYISDDMEEGYPGKLTVEVIYTLLQNNELKIEYSATTDKKTILNLTNHSYFNLSGNTKEDILGHEVTLHAKNFIPVDDTQIPTGEIAPVEGTPFNFTRPLKIGERINEEDEQLKFCKGYDHCWVLDGKIGELRHVASVHEPKSGRYLEVLTTEPGIQFYSGNYLKGKLKGRYDVVYEKRFGFCLETQHFPDSPNHKNFPSVTLNPGEEFHSQTNFKFSVK